MIWFVALLLVLAGQPFPAVLCCLLGVLIEPRCRCRRPGGEA